MYKEHLLLNVSLDRDETLRHQDRYIFKSFTKSSLEKAVIDTLAKVVRQQGDNLPSIQVIYAACLAATLGS